MSVRSLLELTLNRDPSTYLITKETGNFRRFQKHIFDEIPFKHRVKDMKSKFYQIIAI